MNALHSLQKKNTNSAHGQSSAFLYECVTSSLPFPCFSSSQLPRQHPEVPRGSGYGLEGMSEAKLLGL